MVYKADPLSMWFDLTKVIAILYDFVSDFEDVRTLVQQYFVKKIKTFATENNSKLVSNASEREI